MRRNAVYTLLLISAAGPLPAFGQDVQWDVFRDSQSTSLCGLVNAENYELVVMLDTGQLVVVTGQDLPLPGAFVVETDVGVFDVFIDGEPAGFISFALDGDGFRTLWWVTLTSNRAVHIDGITLQASESDSWPADFTDVPCDACPFWDEPLEACFTPTEILVQPQDQTVCEGDRAVLSVTAQGSEIDHFQWYDRGVPMDGQTDSTLTFISVDLFDTAVYSVDVVNTDGSVVSSDPVTLVVEECNQPVVNICGTQIGLIGGLLFSSLLVVRFTRRRFG